MMAWCGGECAQCNRHCALDESMYCSPDCSVLVENGDFTEECVNCDAYKAWLEDYKE